MLYDQFIIDRERNQIFKIEFFSSTQMTTTIIQLFSKKKEEEEASFFVYTLCDHRQPGAFVHPIERDLLCRFHIIIMNRIDHPQALSAMHAK